jgi:hypothetical protein
MAQGIAATLSHGSDLVHGHNPLSHGLWGHLYEANSMINSCSVSTGQCAVFRRPGLFAGLTPHVSAMPA